MRFSRSIIVQMSLGALFAILTIHCRAQNENGSGSALESTASPASVAEPAPEALRQLAGQSARNPEALGRLVKLCESGNGQACHYTALLYASSKTGMLDLVKSAVFFQKGCDAGFAKACKDAGLLYASDKSGVKKLEKTAQYFQKACDGGIAMSCVDAGWLYLSDTSVIKRNNRRALDLMRQGCGLNEMQACYLQGWIYMSLPDFNSNTSAAMDLFWKACDGGYGKACFSLAQSTNENGNQYRDPVLANRLYLLACFSGEPEACKKYPQPALPADAPPGSMQAYADPHTAIYAMPGSAIYIVRTTQENEADNAENEFLHTLPCEPSGRWEAKSRTWFRLGEGAAEVVTAQCSTSKRTREFKFEFESHQNLKP